MIRIFNHWVLTRTIQQILVDVAFFVALMVFSVMWVRSGLAVDVLSIVVFSLLLMVIVVALNAWIGFYGNSKKRTLFQNVARALLSFYVAFPIAYGAYSLLPFTTISRDFFELTLMVAMYGTLANRVRSSHAEPSRFNLRRVLIYGIGAKAHAVEETLKRSDAFVRVVGFYPSPVKEECMVSPSMVLSVDRSVTDTAWTLGVDEIVVAVKEQRGGVMPLKQLLDCKLSGIRVLDLASHFEQRLGQIRLDSLRAGWLIFGEGFDQGYLRPFVKRVFDLVVAHVLLIMALPIMLLTAILIVIESGFPILYRQERVGLNGRVFNVIKFRSMRTDAEKDGKPRWASAKDDRTTRIGRIIRKVRIDELPQLINVIAGDMSMVGPRPERPYFVDRLTREIPFYAVRHSVKPGVTGWAQVCYHYGASMDDSAEKLQYDLYYIKNHTTFLDFVILFETVGVVLTAKGAQ